MVSKYEEDKTYKEKQNMLKAISIYPFSRGELSLIILSKELPNSVEFNNFLRKNSIDKDVKENELFDIIKLRNKNLKIIKRIEEEIKEIIPKLSKSYQKRLKNRFPDINEIAKRYFLLINRLRIPFPYHNIMRNLIGYPSVYAFLSYLAVGPYPNIQQILKRYYRINIKSLRKLLVTDIDAFKEKVLSIIKTKGLVVVPFRNSFDAITNDKEIFNSKNTIQFYFWKVPDMLEDEEPIDIYHFYFFLHVPLRLQRIQYDDVTPIVMSHIIYYFIFQREFLDKKIPLFAFEDFLNEDRFKETLMENVTHTYFVEPTILKKNNKYYPILWSMERRFFMKVYQKIEKNVDKNYLDEKKMMKKAFTIAVKEIEKEMKSKKEESLEELESKINASFERLKEGKIINIDKEEGKSKNITNKDGVNK